MTEDHHELGLASSAFDSLDSTGSMSGKGAVYGRFTAPPTTSQQQLTTEQPQLQVNSCTFTDSVGVMLVCGKHQTVALCSLMPEKSGHWFPMVPLKAQQSQLAIVNQLVRRLLGGPRLPVVNMATPTLPPLPQPYLIDTLRIQGPVSMFFVERFLFYCQLPVTIVDCQCMNSNPATSSTSQSSPVVWWPVREAIKLTSLWGLEPFVYLSRLSTPYPMPHTLQEVTIEEMLAQIAEPAKERRMLQAIGLTEQDILLLYGDYSRHCFPSALMSVTSFQSYLLKRGLNVGGSAQENSNSNSSAGSAVAFQQLFNAFNRQQSSTTGFLQPSFLRLADLLFGLAALDEKTSHGGETGLVRARFMYRYYNRNPTAGGLDYDSMRWFVRDLLLEKKVVPASTEGTGEQQLEAAVKSTYAEMEVAYRQLVTEKAFLTAIANKKVRGTSLLFRLRPSPLGTIIAKAKTSMSGNEVVSSSKYSSLVASSSVVGSGTTISGFRQLTLATHFVSLASDGTIYAPVRLQTLLGVDGHSSTLSPSISISRASRVHSEEYFYGKFLANELIEAIRQFTVDAQKSPWGVGLRTKKMSSWAEKLEQLCQHMALIFRREERIVRLQSPIFVFGDIHGNLHDLMRFEQTLWRRGPLLSGLNYLFLGDYVDRGDYSIEVITYLFSCKLLAPETFILLRGNHETRQINSSFTFLKECQEKFGFKIGRDVSVSFYQFSFFIYS